MQQPQQNNRITCALEALRQAGGKTINALIGLDGFIDAIIHVVDTRESFESFTRIDTIAEFGRRVSKAAGLSTNIEFVIAQTKLGGNGPIFANALLDADVVVTYIGSVGEGAAAHPVFSSIADRAKVYPVCAPGYTDALEFTDGKIMFGKHSTLGEVTWERTLAAVGGLEKFIEMADGADLIGMENWTMIPRMSDILEKIITEVFPALTKKNPRPIAFFDLADPEKRLNSDILAALGLIGRFEERYYTVLGLNEKEIYEIADVYGITYDKTCDNCMEKTVNAVYERLGISCLAVHPTKYAVCAHAGGFERVDGPYCKNPVLTTGAGDNFNAGFCLGLTLGLPPALALTLGVATSGYYVRNAKSPTREQLADFLESWLAGRV